MTTLPAPSSFLENRFYTHSSFEFFSLAGEFLCAPMWTGVNYFLKSYKYSYETSDGSVLRVAEVVGRFFQGSFGVVLTIVGFLPAFFGVCCFEISNLGKREFTWIRPKDPNLSPPLNPPKQLLVTTHNVCAFTDFIGTYSGLPPLMPRIESWTQRILKKPPVACICLQEFGSQRVIEHITTACKDKYPHMIVDVASRTLGLGSGLGILSSYPIEEPMFWEFQNLIGTDSTTRRGVLAVALRLAPNLYVAVLNTHLQSGEPNSRSTAVRAAQMQWLEQEVYPSYTAHLKKQFPNQRMIGVLTAGDLNTGPLSLNNEEWESDTSQRFFSSVNHHYNPFFRQGTTWKIGDSGTGWDLESLDKWIQHPLPLDHILAWKGGDGTAPILEGTLSVDRDLGSTSDHLAVTLSADIPKQP